MKKIILGTRGSPLALWQAEFVKKQLEEEFGDVLVDLKIIKTKGDREQKKSLQDIGGKALFVKEIEDQLLNEKIHLAVHSMKDMPADLPKGLMIGAVLEREDPRDVFISKKYSSLSRLPKKAIVGTGSLRRRAQLKILRPDLEIHPMRGNVDTRLKKLASQEFSAIILAAAGMTRLGLTEKITEYFSTEMMLPAVAQGAIGVEVKESNHFVRGLLEILNHKETAECVRAERSFLREIGGDCHSPIACFAKYESFRESSQMMSLQALVSDPEGTRVFKESLEGNPQEPEKLGQMLAQKILKAGAREVLDSGHAKK